MKIMKKQIMGLATIFILSISIAPAQPPTKKPLPAAKGKETKNQQSAVVIGNVPGWNVELRYLDGNRTQWLVKADRKMSSNIISVHDPKWMASSDNGKTWIFVEWITILDDQGGLWQSKMHAEQMNGKYYLHLENKHVGERNGKDGPIDILDWNRKKWQIASVGGPADNSVVKFNLVAK